MKYKSIRKHKRFFNNLQKKHQNEYLNIVIYNEITVQLTLTVIYKVLYKFTLIYDHGFRECMVGVLPSKKFSMQMLYFI